MNQILKPEINLIKENINNNNSNQSYQEKANTNNKNNKFYKIQFIISSIICFLFILAFFIRILNTSNNEQLSNNLMSIYSVSTLYSNTTDYSTTLLETTTSKEEAFVPFVIGLIKIDKINLNYPIISESNKELLNVSLCRFAGPMPNEIGNLCIAGHNYVDYKFFSRLNELELKDTIKIYDLSGRMVEYSISKIYEVKPNDISCTSQNTNNRNIITLLTCNNVSGKRLVVVAEPL